MFKSALIQRFKRVGVPAAYRSWKKNRHHASSLSALNDSPLEDFNEGEIRRLFHELIESWNSQDAGRIGAIFSERGHLVGFDGSQTNSQRKITEHLREIFARHQTATYLTTVREVRALCKDVALLRAVASMVAPGQSELDPLVNAVLTLVAERRHGEWRIALFQSTPAAAHVLPPLAEN